MAHATIEDWLSKAVGRPMDPDGAYGYQCVDLVDQYAQDIFGIRWQDSVGGVGGARELLDRVPDEYWVRIDNNPNDPNLIPQRGDVVVWDGDETNEFGHTAVVLGADTSGMNVVQQNGNTNWLPSHTAWLQYYQVGTGSIAGWLRPKENKLKGYIQFASSTPVVSPPAATAANVRTTNEYGVNRRKAPDKNGEFIDKFGPELDITIGGYVHATSPYGDDATNPFARVWFVGGISGGYMHSSGFTNPNPEGLQQLPWNIGTPVVSPSNPEPAVPVVPAYDFQLDFNIVNGITVEKLPANNTNVDTGNISANVKAVVDHWWNKLEVNPTIEGTIGEFIKEGTYKSPHWIVGETRIIQTVAMKDRAYHAGPKGNDKYGIEVDPHVTEKNADGSYTDKAKRIQANVKALHLAIEGKQGVCTYHLHKEFMATECSGIDLATVTPDRSAPAPIPEPIASEIDAFFEWLKLEFRNRS